MTELLRQDEGQPAAYPLVDGLTDDAALWQRIEAWIAYRWGERSVTWIVQGPGVFSPPLVPYTIDTVERWTGSDFASTTLDPAPLGLELEANVYRIQATVGSTEEPPPAVESALIRLAEYVADDDDIGVVASRASANLGNGLTADYERPAVWRARALHYSGAADLLRAYRHA